MRKKLAQAPPFELLETLLSIVAKSYDSLMKLVVSNQQIKIMASTHFVSSPSTAGLLTLFESFENANCHTKDNW